MFNFFKNKKTNNPIITFTDTGDRKINQDALINLSDKHQHVMCTADGLGGHLLGELAAQTLCNEFHQQFSTVIKNKDLSYDNFQQIIMRILKNTQQQLLQNPKAHDSHTTMAAAWIDEEHIFTAHIGDSRIIVANTTTGQKWRSRDHSVLQMLVDIGDVQEDDMGTHKEQGKLTKSVSAQKPVKASFNSIRQLAKNEILITCTDGFWEYMSDEGFIDLCNTPSQDNLQKHIQRIKKQAAPNSDNITVQLFAND